MAELKHPQAGDSGRATARGGGYHVSFYPSPIQEYRQYHPTLWFLVIPDDREEKTEFWPINEFPKYFHITEYFHVVDPNTRALDERVRELRELLDDFPCFEEDLEVLPMADDTFEEGDYSAIMKLAPSLPHVMCDDYDPYGGDSVSGALFALLTENGKVRIERISKIIEAARKVAFPELFPAELKEKLKESEDGE